MAERVNIRYPVNMSSWEVMTLRSFLRRTQIIKDLTCWNGRKEARQYDTECRFGHHSDTPRNNDGCGIYHLQNVFTSIAHQALALRAIPNPCGTQLLNEPSGPEILSPSDPSASFLEFNIS